MPYPRWLARINKRVFNPGQVKKGKYPVVTHIGRSSGRTYQTPLDAFPTHSGFVLVARYGPGSDWVRNILAAGSAMLRVEGKDWELGSPRLVGVEEAAAVLVSKPPANFAKAEDFLLMDHRAE